jgi:Protein of unknown function (DUF2950)
MRRERSRENETMLPETNKKGRREFSVFRFLAASVMVMTLLFAGITSYAALKQKLFASAEDAVKDFVAAMRSNDDKELVAIFGTAAKELIFSGDPVSDKQRKERFISRYDQKNSLSQEGNKMVLIIGENDWPFPIPLVKKAGKWFFDTVAGREEILDRRIGENETSTVQTLLAIVDAQREYVTRDHNNNGLLEYAEKFWSDPGKKNGLYWETQEGEKPSPLGPLVAQAVEKGYEKHEPGRKPFPYNGYYYRILTSQGKHAHEGAYSYMVKGKMIGGFAVVAYPAEYGNSGVMTFIVSHDDVVFQKDLGENTVKTAEAMKVFDPGPGWKKVEDGSTQ